MDDLRAIREAARERGGEECVAVIDRGMAWEREFDKELAALIDSFEKTHVDLAHQQLVHCAVSQGLAGALARSTYMAANTEEATGKITHPEDPSEMLTVAIGCVAAKLLQHHENAKVDTGNVLDQIVATFKGAK